MNIQGYIPEKITYVFSDRKSSYRIAYEEDKESFISDKCEGHLVFPCSSETSINTAIKWALASYYCDITKKHITDTKHTLFSMVNKPLKDVKIVGLEYRNQGGRAYKVYIPNYNFPEEYKDYIFIFDLREDTLIYLLTRSCISQGIIKSDLVFAIIGSTLKLIPVPSTIYSVLQENTLNRTNKPISKKDLKIGHLYKSISGKDAHMYLGEHIVYSSDKKYKNEYNITSSKKHLWALCDKKPSEVSSIEDLTWFDTVANKKVTVDLGSTVLSELSKKEIADLVSYKFREIYPERPLVFLELKTINGYWIDNISPVPKSIIDI